jgi:signal transduction histidine kinase/ligand-binding sensor domain-containing protein
MQIADGHLWLPTGKALYDYNITGKGTLQLVKKYNYPAGEGSLKERLYCDKKGQLWLLANGNLYFIDPKTAVFRKIPFSGNGTTTRIGSITFDNSGRLWIGDEAAPRIGCCNLAATGAVVIAMYELPKTAGATDAFHTIKAVTGINGNAAEKILLSTVSSGIYLFDPGNDRFTHVAHNTDDIYSLGNDQVTGMLQDASGLLWVTTAYGAHVYDPARQQLQTVFVHDKTNSPELVTDVLPDNDHALNKLTWLGTEVNELVRYNTDNGQMQHFALAKNGVADRVQYLFQQPNGDLWIGGYYGFYLLKKSSDHVQQLAFQDGNGPYSISCIRQLPGSDLLVSSFENGVWIYRPGTGIIQHFDTKNGLFSNRCTYISGGSGGVYFITHIAPGVSIINVNNGNTENINFQHFLEQELRYPASFTYCSYPDTAENILWVGTGLGLVKYNLNNSTGQLLEPTTRLNTDNEIWSIVPEGKDYLWLKTTFGVYKFNKRTAAVDEFFTLERKHIPSQTGYFRMRRHNETLLIPAYKSFHVLQMNRQSSIVAVSHIVLLDVLIDGKKSGPTQDAGTADIVLQPGETSLALNFASLNFRYPELTRYSYRLYGGDNKWHSLGDKTSLSFASLKPGSYTLQITAQHYGHETVIRPLVVRITVKPFFWQTTWFYILLLAVIVLAIFGLYRYRIQQVMAMQRIRQKISKDLHDDIGATISSIGLLASMARTDQVQAEKKKQFLDRIIEQSRSVSQSLSDIVWSINPQNDHLDVVFARIHRFASELFEAKNIRYEIQLPAEKQLHIVIPMIARQHIYLLFKEAINNIIKYAGATEVQIAVDVQARTMQILIADDGVGFDKNTVKMGNGIYNMQKRVAELKGSFVLESAPGKGTGIKIVIPL